MDLRSFVAVIRARVVLIAACLLITTGVAFAASLVLPATYEASTELVAGPALTANVTDVNQLQTAQQIAATYAAVVQTQQLAQQVVDKLGLPVSASDLVKQISVSVSADAPVITIKVTDASAARSAAIANAVAQQLIDRSTTISGFNQQLIKSIQDQITTIQGQLTTDQAAIAALNLKKQQGPLSDADQATLVQLQQDLIANQTNLTALLTSQASVSATPLTVVDQAVVPTAQASPKLLLNTALGLALGLVLGLGVAFVGAALDDTYKTADELRQELDLPILGTLGSPARRRAAQRHLPPGDAAVPALGGRGGLPDHAHQRRVRRYRHRPAQHPGHQPGHRRRQVHRGREPGPGLRAGRTAHGAGGRRPAQADHP